MSVGTPGALIKSTADMLRTVHDYVKWRTMGAEATQLTRGLDTTHTFIIIRFVWGVCDECRGLLQRTTVCFVWECVMNVGGCCV